MPEPSGLGGWNKGPATLANGPEARKLFEKFMRDVEKLQAQQEQKGG